MAQPTADRKPKTVVRGEKLRGAEKMARIPVKIEPTTAATRLRKPAWIRAKFPGGAEVERLKAVLRDNRLHTVCEEASCPNLGECFRNGTATFMIMGDICTRRCPFCDVAPRPPQSARRERAGQPGAHRQGDGGCVTWSSPRSIATTCATAVPGIL